MICTSFQWQHGEKCLTYVTYRWLIAIFYSFCFVNSVVYSISKNQFAFMFIYLTRWNLFGTMASTVLGAILATQYYKSPDRCEHLKGVIKFYWFLSNLTVVLSLCVSTIYWTALYKGEDINLNNWLSHGTNSVVLVFDLLIIQHPTRFSHFLYPMAVATVYMIFSIVYPLLGGMEPNGYNYIYPILDWRHDTLNATIAAFRSLALIGVCHVIVSVVHLSRSAIHRHVRRASKKEQALPFVNRQENK